MRDVKVTLEAVGVESYEQLYALPTDEVMRRLSANRVPLHEGDAFLAVVMARSVADLRASAERLDDARRRLDRFGIALAVVAAAATVGQLLAVIA